MINRTAMAVLMTALLMLFGSSPPVRAQSLSPESDLQLDYAARLFDNGDYFRAAGEAKRFLFFHPDDVRASEAEDLREKAEKQMADQGRDKPRDDFEPWRWSRPGETDGGTGVMIGLVRFYQHHLRSFRRPNHYCPSYPQTSAYTIQAIRKHGGFLGTFIFVDRFWREVTTAGTPPVYMFYGKALHYDPLIANDYWLTGSVPSYERFTTP